MEKILADKVFSEFNKKISKKNNRVTIVKEFIQNNIEKIPSEKQQQFIDIYESVTPENSKLSLTIIHKIMGEVYSIKRQEKQVNESNEMFTACKFTGWVTLIAFLIYTCTEPLDISIPAFMISVCGLFFTVMFGLVGFATRFEMSF